LLEAAEAAGAPAVETLSPDAARQAAVEAIQLLAGTPEEVSRVEDLRISHHGRSVSVRIYTPAGTGPFPAAVYFHGGGWVLCDLNTHDVVCRAIARRCSCIALRNMR